MANKEEKQKGRVYTPAYIVNNILDFVGYVDINVLNKHVIDNSCGDGAFLVEVVRRYCKAIEKNKTSKTILEKDLKKFIHGIEIDQEEVNKCIKNLDKVALEFGLNKIKWDIYCADTLTFDKFNEKMDFVVGNPPYVRVHNLKSTYKAVKKFIFSNKGMTDLYIVFFEIGLKMLKNDGKMSIITPGSWLRSKAGYELRKYIRIHRTLTKIIDLAHFQPFNATAYTVITLFEKNIQSKSIEFYEYDFENKIPYFSDKLDYNDIFINGNICISKKSHLNLLRDIEESYQNLTKREIIVKNGFATLADKIFIGDFKFSNYVIDIIKASTGKLSKCIYPYNEDGKPFELNLIKKSKDVFKYLYKNMDHLNKRDLVNSDDWYLFGRTQAIKDVYKDKISLNTTIKNVKSIKLNIVPKGCGIYSGLYILSKYSFNEIENVIKTQEFIDYLRLLKNYKSGGYYSFSSLELEKFLNFKLKGVENEQLCISESNS